MVYAHYYAPYPKWPCVWHEANMCCPCYMTSLYSRTFYSILSSPVISLMTMPSTLWLMWWLWLINPKPSCSKNRKEKKKKNKVKRENKIKSTVNDLDNQLSVGMYFIAIGSLRRAERMSWWKMSRSTTVAVWREEKRRTVAHMETTSCFWVKIGLKLWGLTVV